MMGLDLSMVKTEEALAAAIADAAEMRRQRDALAVQLGNVLGMADVFEGYLGEPLCDDAEDQAVLHDAREALKAHRGGTLSELLHCWDAEEAAEVDADAGA